VNSTPDLLKFQVQDFCPVSQMFGAVTRLRYWSYLCQLNCSIYEE